MRIRTLGGCLLALAISTRSDAVSLSGRFTTAAYTFERAVPDSFRQGQFRVYQSGALTLRDLGSPRLSFQTSLRTSLDLLHRAGNDPATRLQHGYLRWAGDRLVLTGGRQFISAGVGVGTLDGVRALVRLRDWLETEAYLGTLAPLGRSRIFNGWDDGHMAGFRMSTAKIPGTRLTSSFYRRTRKVQAYSSAAGAVYPDSLFVDRIVTNGLFEVRPNSLDQQMLGFDAERTFSRVTLFGRVDLNTLAGIRLRRGEGSIRYESERGSLSGEYVYRTPWVGYSDIFSIFTQRASHEATARGEIRTSRSASLFGEYTGSGFDGRSGHRIAAGFGYRNGYLTYTARRGWGGVSDGVGADLRERVSRTVWVSAGAQFEAFRYEEASGPRSRAFSATLGLHLRPSRHVTLSLEGQELSQDLKFATRLNPLTGLRHDIRFFFRASVWFFEKGAPAVADRGR